LKTGITEDNVKAAVFFILGMIVGAAFLQKGAAQEGRIRSLNHVGIVVKNYEESMSYYTKKLGFREAYTIKKADGSPQLTYLQLNRDTFVELIPASPNQQAGISHFGIEVENLGSTVAQLRAKGITVAEPGRSPASALFARINDPEGVQIEIMEFGPESLQRKAMDSWK
jgi:catechol 2,3-dioxygenase-like lactoylglutathione lyase family enzyme